LRERAVKKSFQKGKACEMWVASMDGSILLLSYKVQFKMQILPFEVAL
jgi:hypothetical protein